MSCTRQGYLLMIFNISTDFNIFISSLDSLFRCPPPTHTHKKQQVLNTSVLSEPLENQVIMESCALDIRSKAYLSVISKRKSSLLKINLPTPSAMKHHKPQSFGAYMQVNHTDPNQRTSTSSLLPPQFSIATSPKVSYWKSEIIETGSSLSACHKWHRMSL